MKPTKNRRPKNHQDPQPSDLDRVTLPVRSETLKHIDAGQVLADGFIASECRATKAPRPASTQEQPKTATQPATTARPLWQRSASLLKFLENASAWNAVASVTIAVSTIFYTVYAHRQWNAMSGQIEVMRDANRLTSDSLNLTKSIVKLDQAASVVPTLGFSLIGHTVNIGFENHGKSQTTLVATFNMTLVQLPTGKMIRQLRSEEVRDKIPKVGQASMPNHYYEISDLTEEDMQQYRDSDEAIKVEGKYAYDDGFGEKVEDSFCKVTVNFSVTTCEGVHRYLLSLPPRTQK